MRTPLSELANANELRGSVGVTNVRGITTIYLCEKDAWEACQGMKLEHRRGAFFEVAEEPRSKKTPPGRRRSEPDLNLNV